MSYVFDIETLDLPSAEVVDDNTHDGFRHITVQFNSECEQVPYIIGQFKSGGYSVLQVNFDKNKIRFNKRV